MSKVIGVTPGPVKYELMEESDVKQFTPTNTGSNGQVLKKATNGYKWANETVYSNPFGVSEFTGESNLIFESVPNDAYLNVVVQYSVYVGEVKYVDSASINYLVPVVQLESDRATYRTNVSLSEIINDDVNDVKYYVNGAGVLGVQILATTDEEVTTITATGLLHGTSIYHNDNNTSVVRIDIEGMYLQD